MKPSGIEPAPFRLVGQPPNQLRYCIPHNISGIIKQRRIKGRSQEAGRSPSFSAKVKKKWNCTSTPSTPTPNCSGKIYLYLYLQRLSGQDKDPHIWAEHTASTAE